MYIHMLILICCSCHIPTSLYIYTHTDKYTDVHMQIYLRTTARLWSDQVLQDPDAGRARAPRAGRHGPGTRSLGQQQLLPRFQVVPSSYMSSYMF